MLRKTAVSLQVGDVLECLESCRIQCGGEYLAGDQVKVVSRHFGDIRIESMNAKGQFHFWYSLSVDMYERRISLPGRVVEYRPWYSLFKKVKRNA